MYCSSLCTQETGRFNLSVRTCSHQFGKIENLLNPEPNMGSGSGPVQPTLSARLLGSISLGPVAPNIPAELNAVILIEFGSALLSDQVAMHRINCAVTSALHLARILSSSANAAPSLPPVESRHPQTLSHRAKMGAAASSYSSNGSLERTLALPHRRLKPLCGPGAQRERAERREEGSWGIDRPKCGRATACYSFTRPLSFAPNPRRQAPPAFAGWVCNRVQNLARECWRVGLSSHQAAFPASIPRGAAVRVGRALRECGHPTVQNKGWGWGVRGSRQPGRAPACIRARRLRCGHTYKLQAGLSRFPPPSGPPSIPCLYPTCSPSTRSCYRWHSHQRCVPIRLRSYSMRAVTQCPAASGGKIVKNGGGLYVCVLTNEGDHPQRLFGAALRRCDARCVLRASSGGGETGDSTASSTAQAAGGTRDGVTRVRGSADSRSPLLVVCGVPSALPLACAVMLLGRARFVRIVHIVLNLDVVPQISYVFSMDAYTILQKSTCRLHSVIAGIVSSYSSLVLYVPIWQTREP
ncbi:hypothetical protein B0H13DRAFT_2429868 [Mycena leptocephala]|nr:hypothetical protein B0H13DRAFT_2429868 [Mycena leptocephala]